MAVDPWRRAGAFPPSFLRTPRRVPPPHVDYAMSILLREFAHPAPPGPSPAADRPVWEPEDEDETEDDEEEDESAQENGYGEGYSE